MKTLSLNPVPLNRSTSTSTPFTTTGVCRRLIVTAALLLVALPTQLACDDVVPEPDTPASENEPEDVSDCAPNAGRFRDVIGEPLLQASCINCHVAGGEAAGTRLVLVGGTTLAVAEANMTTLFALAAESVNDTPLLVAKPTLRHPDGHGGGQVVTPGSVDELRLQYVSTWGAGEVEDCTPPAAIQPIDCAVTPGRGARQLRRLTRDEYLATVFDLTGVQVDFVDFPLDQSESTFDSFARSLVVNDSLASKYSRAAEGVGEQLATNLGRVSPCGANGGCKDDFLMEFGARAFRRPLTADEFDRYGAFFDAVLAQDGFSGAVQETVVALLESPNFLYRAELGTLTGDAEFTLTGYEIASELSYLLVGSMPDDALLIAAARGELSTEEGRAAHVERLLQDVRAEATILRFVDQWLDTRGFAASSPAGLASSEVLASMRGALEQEILEATRDGTSLGALLVRDDVLVDQTLATFYGVAAPAEAMSYVDGGGLYGGLLRNGAVLVGHSKSESVAPILRGLLIRERFLCQELPAPPANAASMQEELDAQVGESPRAGSAARLQEATCKGCHQLMDPIGFAFSDYDLVGRHRVLDGEGEIPIIDGEIFKAGDAAGVFVGTAGLAERLASSAEVGTCIQQMWMQFGTGSDDPELRCNVNADQTPQDLNFLTSLTGISQTDHFLARRGDEGELSGLATEALPLQLAGEVINPVEPGPDPEPTPEPVPEPEPEPGPEPNPEGPVPEVPDVFPDGVTVEAYQNLPGDDWGTGYCVRFSINVDTYLGAWSMPIDVVGVITSSWNMARDGDSGTVTFSGEGFTADLGPGVYADAIGFCADY